MRRYGYADSSAAGTVAAVGTIGILIPPSAAMVIYGILTESDIGALFVGGILSDVPLTSIFKGIAPFFVADLIRLAITVFSPIVVL